MTTTPKRIVSPDEKRRRYFVIQDLLNQGWRGSELYRVAKQALDIGPKKVREIAKHINERVAKESAFLNDVEVNATRELDQINEAIRLVLKETRDQKDSNGVIIKKGQPLDKNNYIRLLTLRAKLTGSMKAAEAIEAKRGRRNAYLGLNLKNESELVGGEELAGGEDEEEGGIS